MTDPSTGPHLRGDDAQRDAEGDPAGGANRPNSATGGYPAHGAGQPDSAHGANGADQPNSANGANQTSSAGEGRPLSGADQPDSAGRRHPAEPAVTGDDVGGALAALREQAPLTHCLTNIVVANFTANVLLAAGASPAMVDNPHEAAGFARVAGGVLVNLGTPYDDTVAAMRVAVVATGEAGTPWVLDPVAVGPLAWRTSVAHELIGLHSPTIIRGNASEILALAGGEGGRGVESTHSAADALEPARDLARRLGCVVAVSGAVDQITDGDRVAKVANGDVLLTKVTGAGCALGALMASFAATADDPLLAATAATATFTVAADRAAGDAAGPGTFAVRLLDELAALAPGHLTDRVDLA